jgi:hypothetical protein
MLVLGRYWSIAVLRSDHGLGQVASKTVFIDIRILRLQKRDLFTTAVIGLISDGNVWHVFIDMFNDDSLKLTYR